MKKTELLSAWQQETEKKLPGGLSLTKHDTLLETLMTVIAGELAAGGEIAMPGIGKLKIKDAPARMGRNPKTGESVSIPARRKVAFTASQLIKDKLN